MPRIVTAIWKWIRLNEKQLRIIFTLAAATYVAVEYYDAKRDDKIEHSLTYIERFQAEDVVSARNVVNKFWNLSADDTVISSLGQDQFGVSDAPFGKEGRLEEENSIYKLHVFYGDLAVCTNNGLCDSETSCKFFFKPVRKHNKLVNDIRSATNQRLQGVDLGDLKTFLTSTCRTHRQAD